MDINNLPFQSRRSPVFGIKGAVASSQTLATQIGLEILKKGGNAADASVAIAAALNVTEPVSTGIGGDCFALFYSSKDKTVKGINGSGRSPSSQSLQKMNQLGFNASNPPHKYSIHNVTVPGAAAGWIDTIQRFGSGKLTLREILDPAIQLAENGHPVSLMTSYQWKNGVSQLLNGPHHQDFLPDGKPPSAGQIIKLPGLANTFKLLAEKGKEGFYEGEVADAIVEVVKQMGGLMTLEDLKNHKSSFDDPIKVNYKGVDVWEIPPNGQGLTALMALNFLREFSLEGMQHSSPQHLHLLIESVRLAFADARAHISDPDHYKIPLDVLLSEEYAKERSSLISNDKAQVDIKQGIPFTSCDTVYFCVVDGEGNACSFINSNYMGFGTGIIPKGCGFTLQNRGANFNYDEGHPNCLAANKRPYHTIIPGMATVNGELYCPFGVMGGFMQPQGHVQVLVNMIDFGMDSQSALDAPRFCIEDGIHNGVVAFENGISEETIHKLKSMGHLVVEKPLSGWKRLLFGRGQIIRKNENNVLCAGSDPRSDGSAVGWV
eukprot:TRINITY_DN10467_c0_g1_i1.p1 TRINITY_DN10467_c0_g1~~TRINITY_DN10467_c0_g1_i1.p1  ORF type:complete len:547 (+),score=192.28 TRINITY_DN10467_c0_g1_i1:112-1752(+)